MKSIRKSLILFVMSCGSCFLSLPAFAEGPLDLQLQLKTGDQVPGLEGEISSIIEMSSGQTGNVALRVVLREPEGFYREAFVIKSSKGVQKIIAEGEQLPNGAGALKLIDDSQSYFDAPLLQMNSEGAVGLVLAQGIFLYEEGALQALAVKGQALPGTGSSIDHFLSLSSRHDYYGTYSPSCGFFLNTSGQMVFAAALSDGRNGVFLASRQAVLPVLIGGDPVPDREGLTFRDMGPMRAILKRDHLTIMVYDEQFGTGIFHYAAGRLSTVLTGTDDIGGRGRIGYLASLDGNENGSVALGMNLRENDQRFGSPQLLLWSPASGIKPIADASSKLPGIENGARFFSFVSLDPEDRLVFAAEGRPTGLGFYFWEKGNVEKIVADGDPVPTGGTFQLGYAPLSIVPRPPALAPIDVSPTNGRKEVAFMAHSTAGGPRGPFLWSGGALLPIPVAPSDLPGFDSRPVTETRIRQLTSDGRLFLSAEGCCDRFQALYTTAPAFPQVTYIPFFAAGSFAGFSYNSVIQLANQSHFTGRVLIEAFQETGQPEQPQELIIEPGQVACISLLDAPFRRGYVRVTIEGGAVVFTEALVRASHEGNNFDLIVPTALAGAVSEVVLDAKSENTAVALANPGPKPATVTIRLLNRKRETVGTDSVTLAPNQQSSFLVTDLFGPNAGGEHRLRFECDSDFLAAPFSLNSFRFTPLTASLPSSPAPRAWSLVNLYPANVEAVTASERGAIAFATKDGRLMVVRQGIASEVPMNGGTSEFRFSRMIGFRERNGREELLFIGDSEDYGSELLAWDGDELRPVIERGPLTLETGRTLHPAPDSIAELNRQGDLLVGAFEVNNTSTVIGMSFLLHDGVSFHELFSLPGVTEVASVAFNSRGQVAVITGRPTETKTLGFFDGQEYWTIGEVGSRPLVDWWRPTDFIQIALAEDGTTFLAAGVRQTMEESRTGLFAVKDGNIRTVLVGSVAPAYSLTELESPFQVNGRGNLAFAARLATSADSYGSPAFLVVENTTLQTSVLIASAGSAPAALGYSSGFHWTDNDELFFEAGPLSSSEGGLYCWRAGGWTKVLDRSRSVLNTPGAAVSPAMWHQRVWPVPGFDSPIVSVYVSGDAPGGLYLGVRGEVRELFFPQVIGAANGSAPVTDLTMTNDGQETALVRLRSPDGRGGANFVREVLLDGKEDASVTIDGDTPFIGWLLAESVGGDVGARVGLSLFEGTADYVRLAVPFSIPRRETFAVTPPLTYGELGLAFANPYAEPVEVVVELLTSGLEAEERETVQIPAQGHKSLYVSEIFGAQVPGRLLRIQADFPVATFGAVQSERGVAVQPVF